MLVLEIINISPSLFWLEFYLKMESYRKTSQVYLFKTELSKNIKTLHLLIYVEQIKHITINSTHLM